MPVKPGQSGNPGGRPKIVADIRDLARQQSRIAIEVLVEIARSGKQESARVSAAVVLLDRGYGKPTQPLAGDPEKPPIEVNMGPEERARRAREDIDRAFAERQAQEEPSVDEARIVPPTSISLNFHQRQLEKVAWPVEPRPSFPIRRRRSPSYGGGWAG